MALNISEDELQDLIIKSLKAGEFRSSVKGADQLHQKLAHDKSAHFIPSFLVDFKLEQEYAKGALEVIDSISDYEIINGESIKNISLEVNKGGVIQYLKPDIVLYNEKTRQLVIMELKVAGDTERQAVTELAAFLQEIKNHLPFSSELDVTLVVIAESYKTLLNHAVGGLVLDTRHRILCLRPELDASGSLELHIETPRGWTDIGQSYTAKNTFLSKTVLLKPKKQGGERVEEITELSDLHRDTVEVATDMLMHEAAKINTHGFFLECGHEVNGQRFMAININLLNPYVFLQFAIDNEMPVNDNPLTAYLKSKQMGDDKVQETASLAKLVTVVQGCCDDLFEVSVEETTTYHENMQPHSDFRRKYVPISFDSWGAIGDYVRYLYKHPAFKSHYYLEQSALSPLAYKQPYLGLQIVNLITGDYLFKKGGFNATDTYKFCQLLEFYQQRHIEKLKDEEPKVGDDCSLVYTIVDLAMALKEFNMRINMVDDEDARSCPPITLTVSKADHDVIKEIKDFSFWQVNQFTAHSAIINKLLIKHCHDAAAYFNPNSFRHKPEMKAAIQKDTAEFMREVLMFYIVGAYIDQDEEIKPEADKIIDDVYFPGFKKENAAEAITALMTIKDEEIIQTWSPAFLAFADKYIPEVFHELPLSAAMFEGFDWAGIKESVLERKRRGETYLALSIDSAGNFGITNLPNDGKFRSQADIADYNEEIFFINGMAGMSTVHRVKWTNIEGGEFFDKFK